MNQQIPTMRIVLEEAFKTNFSIFDGYDDAVRKQQITKFVYIEKIAHQLEKDLTNVNLFDIFSNNNNIILADEGQINTVLIDFDRTKYFKEPETIREPVNMSEDDLIKIQSSFDEKFKERIILIEKQIATSIRNAENRMTQYHRELRQASDNRMLLKTIQIADSSEMKEHLHTIANDPRFIFNGFSRTYTVDDTIEFIIDQDIINTHVNRRAGLDIRVNLGQFKAQLVFGSGLELKVCQYNDNLWYDSYIHPHISSGGSICLGNMSDLYAEAIEKTDITSMFNIMMQIMLNYNDRKF